MKIIKALLSLSIAVSICISQEVNISGTVTDTGGTPIAGAAVKLEIGGLSTTTEVDGDFTITGIVGVVAPLNQTLQHKLSVNLKRDILFINIHEKTVVEIASYNLQGKVLFTLQNTMDVGTHSIALPHFGAGVYLYKVKSGSNEHMLKGNSISGVSQAVGISAQASLSHNAFAKRAKVNAIKDVIAVIKNGYLNYRVIVTNSDTSGIEIKMIVSAGTTTDADGNVYQTVKIGNQEWTVENLRTTKYRDGTAIPFDTSATTWANATTPKFCYYGNTTNADSIKKFGVLYKWYVVDTANSKKIAPPGWHVPTDAEWDTLQNYLIANGYNWDGTTTGNKIAKSLASKADWSTYSRVGTIGAELTKNNMSGFSALPGGCRVGNGGFFSSIGDGGDWWSASESDASTACSSNLSYGIDYFYCCGSGPHPLKSCGFSVRLLRDN